ncbi:ankyrin repeat-containing protein [Acrasis kona]|uniref:Ankyrin repeat-containing protein n=1 Tax=Acrasis kona TaxID=1008807 RepID=A0AAW2ZJ86_9EUKA
MMPMDVIALASAYLQQKRMSKDYCETMTNLLLVSKDMAGVIERSFVHLGEKTIEAFIYFVMHGKIGLAKIALKSGFFNIYAQDNLCFRYCCRSGCLEIIMLLVSEYGLEINNSTSSLQGLQWAVQKGHLNVIKYLLLYLDNIEASEVQEFVTKSSNCYEVVKLLSDRVINKPINWSAHLWLNACDNGNMKLARYLLANNTRPDNTCFQEVCRKGFFEFVEMFLKEKLVDPSIGNNYAIRIASSHGYTSIVSLLLSDDRVDPSARDYEAVQIANKNGHKHVLELLLNHDRVTNADFNLNNLKHDDPHFFIY